MPSEAPRGIPGDGVDGVRRADQGVEADVVPYAFAIWSRDAWVL